MRLDPRTIVELVQRLEQQHAEHRPHLADVAMALHRSDFEQAAEATGNLRSAIESIIVIRARLKGYVASSDGLGEPGSLVELAVRARRIVITMQADRLRDAFSDQMTAQRARGWFIGKFRSGIEEVCRYLYQLIKSTGGWEPYREGQQLPVGMKEVDRVTMYRATVHIAQRAMRELGADPDLSHFLRSGIAATEWHDAHTGCKQIASALAGEIGDVDQGATRERCARECSAAMRERNTTLDNGH